MIKELLDETLDLMTRMLEITEAMCEAKEQSDRHIKAARALGMTVAAAEMTSQAARYMRAYADGLDKFAAITREAAAFSLGIHDRMAKGAAERTPEETP